MDSTAVLERDLFLNFLVVIMLFVGGHELLAGSQAAQDSTATVPSEAAHVFVEPDGDLHVGSLRDPHVALDVLEAKLRTAGVDGDTTIVVHHTEDTRAGLVHDVLRAAGRIAGASTVLALTEYTSLPCEQQEQNP